MEVSGIEGNYRLTCEKVRSNRNLPPYTSIICQILTALKYVRHLVMSCYDMSCYVILCHDELYQFIALKNHISTLKTSEKNLMHYHF